MHKTLLIFIAILGTISCSKSKKYAGDYSCEVKRHYHDINGNNFDTTYQASLEAEREKKSIIVFGRTIPGDSLVKGEWYRYSGYPSVFEIMVIEDSMYVYTWTGGLGGGTSYAYSCKQE